MPTGRDFTAEQWREIDAARSRLQAYKNKVQPYPVGPADEPAAPSEQVIVHRHISYNSDVSKKQWHRIDAISGEVKYLREKLDQILEKRKARGKY